MAKITGINKPYGTIIRIKGDVLPKNLEQLGQLFSQLIKTEDPLYLDLGKIEATNDSILEQIFATIKQYAEQGLHITLVQASPDIREAIRSEKLHRYVSLSDFLDEAIFPQTLEVHPKIDEEAKPAPLQEYCPSCDRPIPLGTLDCPYCGYDEVTPRKSERHSLSIPFLYGQVYGGEFLDSVWTGAVTDNLDLTTFAGLGFICQKEMKIGESIYLIFPTLQWEFKPRQPAVLPIFHGRVKHASRAGDWYRLGIALCDMYEYSGRFSIITAEENS